MTPSDSDPGSGGPGGSFGDPFASDAGHERAERGSGGSTLSQEVLLWGSERPAPAPEQPDEVRPPRSPSGGNGQGSRRRHSSGHRHSSGLRRSSSYRRSRRRSRSRSRNRRPRASLMHRFQRAWSEHPVRTRGGLVAIVLLCAGVAIVAAAYWQAYHVYKDLRGAVPQFEQAKADLVHGKIPSESQLALITAGPSRAQYDVDHAAFPYRLVGSVPVLGAPVKAATWASAAANEDAQAVSTMHDIVQAVIGDRAAKSGSLRDATIPIYQRGAINVALLKKELPQIADLLTSLQAGAADMRRVPAIPFVSSERQLKQQVLQNSATAISLVQRGLAGARLLPGFLGADGPRTYFVALQTSVDQRATGGAVLGYALIQIDHGRVRLLHGGGINEIDRPSGIPNLHVSPAVDWYLRNTGAKFLINNSANYGPDFPAVAQAWAQMVQKVTGLHIDGAIAFDPFAVQAMLRGQGQLRIPAYPHQRIGAANVVKVVSYDQFFLPQAQQIALPGQLVAAAFKDMERPRDFYTLATGLGKAIPGRHIQIWAAIPKEEDLVKSLGWDGALSSGPGDTLALAYDKRISGKQDYWTRQSIDYDVSIQSSGAIHSSYRVTVSDDIPHLGQSGRMVPHVTPWGLNVAMLNLYVPKQARFQSVAPDYREFPIGFVHPDTYVRFVKPRGFVQHDEGPHKVFTQTVTAYPAHPGTVTFRYSVPGVVQNASGGKVYRLTVDAQPLYHPASMTIRVQLPPGTNVKAAAPVAGQDWTINGNVLTVHLTLSQGFTTSISF